MLENYSNEARKKFLLDFTQELIRNSKSMELFKLEEIVKRKDKILMIPDVREEVKKKLNPQNMNQDMKEDPFEKVSRPIVVRKAPISRIPLRRSPQKKRVLRVPEYALPDGLKHLKPVVSYEKIDLGELNPFVNDKNVRTIETEGEGKDVFVTGKMGKRPTGLKFSKEEIDQIIDKFSQKSKIPKTRGMFKVVVGNLMIIAMISEKVSSRFVIKKIN